MAQLGQTFNRDELPKDEGGDYSPLPDGWYTTQITGSELKTTNSGTGQYIRVEFTVVGENYQGRKVWGNINIRNDSEKAEEIGRKQLNAIMEAVGLATISDTDELVGKCLSVKLKIKPAEGQYEASNEVKGFKASEGGAKAPVSSGSTGGAKAPPWAAKK